METASCEGVYAPLRGIESINGKQKKNGNKELTEGYLWDMKKFLMTDTQQYRVALISPKSKPEPLFSFLSSIYSYSGIRRFELNFISLA